MKKVGIRYTKSNGILHVVIGCIHLKASRDVFIIENTKSGKTTWLYGWK
jgi:hypothetical protein